MRRRGGALLATIDSVATLSGRLVTLRPVSRDDYPTLFRWRSSFETVHMLNFKRRVATFEEFVRDIEGLLPNAMLLLVQDARHRTPIGYALAHSINPWDGWLAVGMYVEPEYRLRGHGGEAALLSIDFVFRTYPLRKVLTEVYEFAEDVRQMLTGMGFEEAGFMPDHYWHDDRSWGVHYMVLTRQRWDDHRERFSDIVDVQRRFDELHAVSPNGGSAQ